MGREARCDCRWPGGRGEVKALLEPDVLVLRGTLSRKVPRGEIEDARVVGEALRLRAGGEELELTLGGQQAARWLEALKAPPPSLARKLGVGPGTRVHVVGSLDSPELAEATRQVTRVPAARAELVIAAVQDAASADRAADAHGRAPAGAPLWVVYRKGKDSPFGETAVRTALKARGLTDTKVASVSGLLTAARFHRTSR